MDKKSLGKQGMAILSILFIMMLSLLPLSAQNKISDMYVPGDPQVWNFIKYGGQTPDLYTGTVRVEIPIYTYKDPDFEIPISLSYASNGYMPNVQANFVGLGWMLNAGGVISRRVQGIKDEGTVSEIGAYGTSLPIEGFYRFARDNSVPDIMNRPLAARNMVCYSRDNRAFETEPDIYIFRFPGHNGKFCINEYGVAECFDTSEAPGEYKVSFTNFIHSIFLSGLQITTGDGVQYEFGQLIPTGGTSQTSQLLSESGGEDYSFPPDPFGDDWLLKRIVSPNGRTVVYSYEYDPLLLLNQSCHPYAVSSQTGSYYYDSDSGHWSIMRLSSESGSFMSSFSAYKILHTTPAVRLTSITVYDKDETTAECTISFSYGTRDHESYRRGGLAPIAMSNVGKLTQILVRDKEGTTLAKADMTYSYTGGNSGNPVLLLKKVHIHGLGNYQMDYVNESASFPYHGCPAIDHWGYWNQFNVTDYQASWILPIVDVDSGINRETIVSTNRNPNAAVSQSGMLSKLTYPTGGWTTFEYEAHDYHRKIVKDGTLASMGYPVIETLPTDLEAGGVRIKRITDYASQNKSVSREYTYKLSPQISSGLMYHFPRYYEMNYYELNYPDISHSFIAESRNDRPAYLLDESHIGYSRVSETYDDGSCVVYDFTDYETVPDVTEYADTIAYSPIYDGLVIGAPVYANAYYRVPQSLSHCRGKMLSKEVRGTDQTLIEKTTYQYLLSLASSRFVQSIKKSAASMYVYRTYTGNYPLISASKKEYGQGAGERTTMTNFSYNSLGEMIRSDMYNSDNSLHSNLFYRVKDLPSAQRTAIEDSMECRNLLSPVLYHVELIGNKVASAQKTKYSLFNVSGRLIPLLSETAEASVTDAAFTSPWALTWKPIETVTVVDGYTRPMEIKDANNVYTTWFWGYGGLYPVARVVNCNLAQIANRIHANLSGFTFGWGGLSDTEALQLRKIPGSSMTHWTFRPLVGMTSVTDPSGRKTTINYNDYGRIISVIGPDGNVEQEYDYSVDNK